MKNLFRNYFITVVLIMTGMFFVFGFVETQIENFFWQDIIDESDANLFRPIVLLVQDNLGDADTLDADIRELEKRMGMAVRVVSPDEVHIRSRAREELQAGEPVMSDDGDRVYFRIDRSDLVVAVTLPVEVDAERKYRLFTVLYVISCMLIISLVLALPFTRSLENIGNAAEAFGQGRFDRRAKMPRYSALKSLAAAFNSMADRISRLIRSHKALTHAASHELRTPIARMRFNLELLLGSTDEDGRHHYADELLLDIDEMDMLVSELLTYARFDREVPELHTDTREIGPWLDDLIAAEQAMKPGIVIDSELRLQRHHRKVVFASHEMTRALRNLLQNAERYGAGRIMVRVDRKGENCLIHVDDDGPGIPPEDRQRVKEPFERVDGSRSRETGGFGLGLSIVCRILEWHRGEVMIGESEWGGARVSLIWPGFGDYETGVDHE